ncbi:hypothetical protein SLS58_005701 [Diplodia intermedia]|uniref:Uncharacterized protein n=1 Tax=Diplodia intermedia TaxID=856260 RepID=A0ABR3TQ30_9PEZI
MPCLINGIANLGAYLPTFLQGHFDPWEAIPFKSEPSRPMQVYEDANAALATVDGDVGRARREHDVADASRRRARRQRQQQRARDGERVEDGDVRERAVGVKEMEKVTRVVRVQVRDEGGA